MKKKKDIKLFAIWKYDLAPYYLGGEVIELKEDGYVTIKGYNNCKFKYFKLYPLKEGEKIYELIVKASNIYREERDKAHDVMMFNIKRYLNIEDDE